MEIETFLKSSTQERLQWALDPKRARSLESYLGRDAFAEYADIARRVQRLRNEQHLGGAGPINLIFVPGVMGSLLGSSNLGGVWWIDALRTRHHLPDLKLSPDGLTDANPNHQITPVGIDIAYESFLASVLQQADFVHVVFPYDWRKAMRHSTAGLRRTILAHYEGNGHEPIHLVAHSMGGLLIRAALMEYGEELWPKVGKIAFIGTPHYGSPAIAGYLKNHLWGFELLALLGWYIDRAAFRTLRGILTMLPAPVGIYPDTRQGAGPPALAIEKDNQGVHPCTNFDLYRASEWKLGLKATDESHLQEVLDQTADFYAGMAQAHWEMDQSRRDRMLVIAGVGYKSLFHLAYKERRLGGWEHMEKITLRIAGDRHRDGDGRVPLASAMLEFVGDVRFVRGVHNGLPTVPEVSDDVFRWLRGGRLRLPTSAEEALSEHLSDGLVSATPYLDGTFRAEITGDDPGYLDIAAPDSSYLEGLDAQLPSGLYTEFNRVRLL
jgi:pimeloyl-ACP methyl ester carboxylesterase